MYTGAAHYRLRFGSFRRLADIKKYLRVSCKPADQLTCMVCPPYTVYRPCDCRVLADTDQKPNRLPNQALDAAQTTVMLLVDMGRKAISHLPRLLPPLAETAGSGAGFAVLKASDVT